MNTTQLDAIATKIKSAGDLWDLHSALVEFEIAANTDEDDEGRPMPAQERADTENLLKARSVDICELPTFGGANVTSEGVWSWNQDHVLAGEGAFKDWEIRERD